MCTFAIKLEKLNEIICAADRFRKRKNFDRANAFLRPVSLLPFSD